MDTSRKKFEAIITCHTVQFQRTERLIPLTPNRRRILDSLLLCEHQRLQSVEPRRVGVRSQRSLEDRESKNCVPQSRDSFSNSDAGALTARLERGDGLLDGEEHPFAPQALCERGVLHKLQRLRVE